MLLSSNELLECLVNCHAASITHNDDEPLKERQAFRKASLFSGNTIGMAWMHTLSLCPANNFSLYERVRFEYLN